ncbi:MAG: hypothetical protein AAFV53_37035 [Myxococcota bacterium]
MSRWLQWLMLSLTLGLALGGVHDAAAKNKKKSQSTIRNVGIQSFDRVFKEARTIDRKITDGQRRRRSGRQRVTSAMNMKRKTSFSSALRELNSRAQGKVKVATGGGRPQLRAADAVPSNVQRALGAVNTAVDDYKTLLTNLVGIPGDARRMVQRAKQLDVAQLTNEMSQLSVLNLGDRLTQVRRFRNNIQAIGQMPKKADRLIQGLRSDVKAVSSVFPSR